MITGIIAVVAGMLIGCGIVYLMWLLDHTIDGKPRVRR